MCVCRGGGGGGGGGDGGKSRMVLGSYEGAVLLLGIWGAQSK